MSKFIFISNNNIGTGQSGGDTIFLNLAKFWQPKNSITIFGSSETKRLVDQYCPGVSFIKTDVSNPNTSLSIVNLFKHQFRRTFLGLKSILHHLSLVRSSDFIYSVSDFYPDLLIALVAKLFSPRIKWIAGFYLKAPNPFSFRSPYNLSGHFLKGFVYNLFQYPGLMIIKLFANVVFVTSEPDKKFFPHKKVVVIQGGVDLDQVKNIKTIPLSKRKYDAVFLGRLHPQKGVLELVDIWQKVVKVIPDAKLAIIGDGQLEDQLKTKIVKLDLLKNIDVLGFLSGPAKFRLFANSKIFVHPATYDSGGMSAAEAMTLGLPAVTYNLPALKTYYPTGTLKTNCFDQNQFAQNIIKLLKNKHLYTRLSGQAQLLVQNHWSWTNKSLSIYQTIFHKNKPSLLAGS